MEVARERGADAVAHGCTGKGNDQVRFEVAVAALAPDLQVLAPGPRLGHDAASRRSPTPPEHGIAVPVDERRGVLHRREPVGPLDRVRPARGPVDGAARGRCSRVTADPATAPDAPQEVVVGFEDGVPVALDGERAARARPGRRSSAPSPARTASGGIDMIENRLVGIKSREVYEAPGRGGAVRGAPGARGADARARPARTSRPTSACTLRRLVYNGLWFSPLRAALDAFVRRVAGGAHRRGRGCGCSRATCQRRRPARAGVAVRPRPGDLRGGRRLRPRRRPRASSTSSACRRAPGRRGDAAAHAVR